MALHLLHGCTTRWRPGRQSTRNFVPESALEAFLKSVDRRYERWPDDDLDPHVLSVDDSTKGAAHACRVARALGHEVALFVNPYEIASARAYWFSMLDAILDSRQVDVVSFLGARFRLHVRADLRGLRLAIKERLRCLPDAEGRILLAELSHALGAQEWEIEEHAQTMTTLDLIELHHLGVSIESHGWSHRSIGSMTSAEFTEHILLAEQWLFEELAVEARHYAVPFGTDLLTSEQRSAVDGPVMLATQEYPEGLIACNQWNRTEITSRLQDVS